MSFAAGRPGDIKKCTLQKFDLVDLNNIKTQRLRPAGLSPHNVARVGCVACLASVAVSPRLPSAGPGPRVSTRAKFGPEVEPGSCIPSWNQAWELDSDLKESLGPGRDPLPQAFNPHPGEPRVEPGPMKSLKSLEFELGPRALGRIRPGAGGTGTNSDRCHRCLKSGL